MEQVLKDIHEVIENEDLFLPFKHSTLLVTGATGLIGSMLCKTVATASARYSLGIKVVGQIRNFEKARYLFGEEYKSIKFVTNPDITCDYIVHTASPTSSRFFVEHPVGTIRTSVESTMDILEIAKKNNAAVVYLSSMEQYGVPYESGQEMTEDKVGIIDHLNIRSSYSESKRLCECMCAAYSSEYDVNIKIARLAQTMGAGVPLTDNRMPMQFARSVVEGKDIILHTDGKSIINYIYLSDAITGILTILLCGKSGEAYNVCNDKETRSVRDIANLVAQKVADGRIGVKIEIPDGNSGYAPVNTMHLNSNKLRSLGWSAAVEMQEGYVRLVKYINESMAIDK